MRYKTFYAITAAVAIAAATGCSGAGGSARPYLSGSGKSPGGTQSSAVSFGTGTLTLPGTNGYSETFTIASAMPSNGVEANVQTSTTEPAQLSSSSALCSPSNVSNPLLFITFNVTNSVTITPGSLVVTVPSSVPTNMAFDVLFVDATNPPSACYAYPGSNNTSATGPFAFNVNGGASMTLSPNDTYVIVLNSSPHTGP